MDELTNYIFHNYQHLMTMREHAAYRSLIGLQKIESVDDRKKGFYRQRLVSSDPEVLRLLEAGEEGFKKSVAERILRDSSDQVFLNYCARCGSLARTPEAKQCPKCFHSWHDDE